jgi:glycosyltransferase involved in cell wall biosynthesis
MAKLLFITQKVDKNDDVLGFVHGWLREFAKHFERIIVICLQKGEYSFPQNVEVLSLGKENGTSRLKYVLNFYKYTWQERNKYDAVFVHMNPIYVLCGGLYWKIARKKILLWYLHPGLTLKLRLAHILSDKVITAVRGSFPLQNSSKVIAMGHGIDTNFFKKAENTSQIPHSILSLGRISPVKDIDLLIGALNLLKKDRFPFICRIVGNYSSEQQSYYQNLLKKVDACGLNGEVMFEKGVPYRQTPEIYNRHELFINLTPSGSFDKTILEAMACESLVLTSNRLFRGLIDEKLVCRENDPADVETHILSVLNLSQKEKISLGRELRNFVVQNHSLEQLAVKITSVIL